MQMLSPDVQSPSALNLGSCHFHICRMNEDETFQPALILELYWLYFNFCCSILPRVDSALTTHPMMARWSSMMGDQWIRRVLDVLLL